MLPRVDGPAVPVPPDTEELCSLVAQEAAACAAAIDAVEKGPGTADAVRARVRIDVANEVCNRPGGRSRRCSSNLR